MKNNKKIIAIIQARVNSTRLPNKVLLKLNKVPTIIRMIDRLKISNLIDEIWVATGTSKINDKLVRILDSSKNINVFRRDDLDVLSRYSEVAKKTKANISKFFLIFCLKFLSILIIRVSIISLEEHKMQKKPFKIALF